jgi:hypothetical protein
VALGYTLSGLAVAMHFWEIRGNGPALHQVALLLITIGFLLLTTLAVAEAAFRGKGQRRLNGRASPGPCAWRCSPCRSCTSAPGMRARPGRAN